MGTKDFAATARFVTFNPVCTFPAAKWQYVRLLLDYGLAHP
jgi:hypothetical protein